MARQVLKLGLLLFVVLSIGVQIGKEMQARSGRSYAAGPAGSESSGRTNIIAYYFHGQARCATCNTIEAYSREAFETYFREEMRSGRLEWHVVNFDESGNEHYLDDYELYSSSLVLVDARRNGAGSWKTLQDVWQLTGDKAAFLAYVRREVNAFLGVYGG